MSKKAKAEVLWEGQLNREVYDGDGDVVGGIPKVRLVKVPPNLDLYFYDEEFNPEPPSPSFEAEEFSKDAMGKLCWLPSSDRYSVVLSAFLDLYTRFYVKASPENLARIAKEKGTFKKAPAKAKKAPKKSKPKAKKKGPPAP